MRSLIHREVKLKDRIFWQGDSAGGFSLANVSGFMERFQLGGHVYFSGEV